MTGNGGSEYEIAEIVAVKGTVSSADVTNLQNYWKRSSNSNSRTGKANANPSLSGVAFDSAFVGF